MTEATTHPHLDAYVDVTSEIENAIKIVHTFLGYQKTYFSVQNTLASLLFRLLDAAYLERIEQSKNQSALDEIQKAMPYKDIMTKLIDSINIFESESQKLLAAIQKTGKIDSSELASIYPYLYTLAEDNTSHDRIPWDILSFFFENTKEKCQCLSTEECALFTYLLIRIKAKGRYYFAYPHLADELVAYVRLCEQMPWHRAVAYYLEAGDYYATARRRDKAMLCYKNAATTAKAQGELERAAYALQKYYRQNQTFPPSMREQPDIAAIEAAYGNYAGIVLQGVKAKALQVDPVEFTDIFAEHFQEVMHKVEAEIDRVGDLHTVYQRWNLMEIYFAEKNIVWRSPKAMNPRVMFD